MRSPSRRLAGVLFLLLAAGTAHAQVRFGELTGRVTDAATGESIAGASVLVQGTSFGTNTGANGRYDFRIPEGRYPVQVSFVGYGTVRDTVDIRRGQTTTYNATLTVDEQQLGDVEVEGRAAQGLLRFQRAGGRLHVAVGLQGLPHGLAGRERALRPDPRQGG